MGSKQVWWSQDIQFSHHVKNHIIFQQQYCLRLVKYSLPLIPLQRHGVSSHLLLVVHHPFTLYRSPLHYSLIQEVLQEAGVDIQLAAAGSFLTVLQDDIILIQTHMHSILQIVLLNLDHRDAGEQGSNPCAIALYSQMTPPPAKFLIIQKLEMSNMDFFATS